MLIRMVWKEKKILLAGQMSVSFRSARSWAKLCLGDVCPKFESNTHTDTSSKYTRHAGSLGHLMHYLQGLTVHPWLGDRAKRMIALIQVELQRSVGKMVSRLWWRHLERCLAVLSGKAKLVNSQACQKKKVQEHLILRKLNMRCTTPKS